MVVKFMSSLVDMDKFMSLRPSICSTHFLVGLGILEQAPLDSNCMGELVILFVARKTNPNDNHLGCSEAQLKLTH